MSGSTWPSFSLSRSVPHRCDSVIIDDSSVFSQPCHYLDIAEFNSDIELR